MLPDDGRHHRETRQTAMRGTTCFTRNVSSAMAMVREDLAETIGRHFDYFFDSETKAPRGVFIKAPGLPYSIMFEWLDVNAGVAIERASGGYQLWLGRFTATVCHEPRSASALWEA